MLRTLAPLLAAGLIASGSGVTTATGPAAARTVIDQRAGEPGEMHRFQHDYGSANYNGLAQTLTVGVRGRLVAVDVYLAREQWTKTALRFEIHRDRPDGDLLATSDPVKASDILVRYKSGFLDEDGVVNAMLDLILRNPERLTNRLLRHGFRALRPLSYRLTQWHKGVARRYLQARLQQPVHAELALYRRGESSVRQSRDAVAQLMQCHAAIAYASP